MLLNFIVGSYVVQHQGIDSVPITVALQATMLRTNILLGNMLCLRYLNKCSSSCYQVARLIATEVPEDLERKKVRPCGLVETSNYIGNIPPRRHAPVAQLYMGRSQTTTAAFNTSGATGLLLPAFLHATEYSRHALQIANKLLYRSKQRGFLELDLLVGLWAEQEIPKMDTERLQQLAIVLEQVSQLDMVQFTPHLWC